MTYRAAAHSTSDDPSRYRPKEEWRAWPLGDPIERLKHHLIALGEWSEERHAALEKELDAHVTACWKEAVTLRHAFRRPALDPLTMFEDVFKEMPPNLARQREELRALRDTPAVPHAVAPRSFRRAEAHGTHEHGAGAELGHGRDAGARSAGGDPGRGCRLFRRRVPRHRGTADASTASIACSTRRSPKAASSPPRSAWASTASSRSPRSSSPTTSIPGFDQIVSELARLRYRSAGDFSAPVTIRMPCGGGIRGGQTHSQSPEALFAHVCGIKVVMPSNPYDAKGLLISCDRGRRSGDVLRAQAPLQRAVRRRPAQAGVAVEHAPAGRSAGRTLHRAHRPCRDRARREARRPCSPTARWCTWPRRR